MRSRTILLLVAVIWGYLSLPLWAESGKILDEELIEVLKTHRFTGRIESTLREKLGRPIDRKLAKLGRLLWFDTISGLNDDKRQERR